MGRRTVASVNRPEYEKLLAVLREVRESQGITQGEAARRLGIPQPRLSAIELGTRRMDVLEFLDLAHAIGVKPSVLVDQLEKAIDSGSREKHRQFISQKGEELP